MTTTKHEGECCAKCADGVVAVKFLSEFCKNRSCPCHEPTGAGMRECGHGEMLHWKKCPDCREYMVTKDFEVRLSRLHSRIVEGIDFLPFRSEHIYDDKTADKIKEIVNQAFKDL